ncbi:MAG: hypothetical protein QNJ65_24270 [Xenococcaceae cyanobacterium MO_234.B1]|nr:hypothetical protein [Xenococcaceae cyanobacterium MO_234.B1]
MSEEIGVSKSAVYDQLNRLEPNVSKALVTSTALELTKIIHQLGVELPVLLPRYRVKILDGNGLGATEHRLSVLRNTRAGPLPGKSKVVLDPQLGLAIDLFPCEDGHVQERSLLPEVILSIEASDLIIADRNFCTIGFLFGVHQQQAAFIIRQHQNLPLQELDELVAVGRTEGGELFQQTVVVSDDGQDLYCRRILVKLEQPTRDGETEIAVLTNLPQHGCVLQSLFLFEGSAG